MAQDPSELSMAVAGPRAWHICRHEFQSLPCRSCSKDGVMLINGIQDVVNVNKLGRPLYDLENFKVFHAEVNKAAEKSGLTGRNPINTTSGTSRSEPKLVQMKNELAVYGGALVEKALDVGVKTTDATVLVTGIRNSTLVNIVTAVIGGGLAYYWRNDDTKGIAAAAFSAASVNNLIEDAAEAAGLPGATGVGAVRRVSIPFVPAGGPVISPSQAAAQSGAPALF